MHKLKGMKNWFSLDHKIAVVTGGAGVLGFQMAYGLAAAGAKVAIMSRTIEKVERAVDELQAAGYEALALAADVLDNEQLIQARQSLQQKWGAADILVNAAGGNMKGLLSCQTKPFLTCLLRIFRG